MDDRMSLYVGTCQICPHDTGRCKARKATVDDLVEALRADSDALIIRRDENGEWPEWAMAQVHAWDMTGDNPIVLFDLLHTHYNDPDKWASSQGVEP